MTITLIDHESGHQFFYGSKEDAIELFNSSDFYWKLIIKDGEKVLTYRR